MSDSLQPQGLYPPWNSPGQNTGVGDLSLLPGIFPTQVSLIADGFFTSWATGEARVPSKTELPAEFMINLFLKRSNYTRSTIRQA